jgi:transcriptional regulator with XRE-family HTH domain
MQDIVAAMVTRRRVPIPKQPQLRRLRLFVREWRKFMGTSAVDCAIALDIERESFLRLEREPWRITVAELDLIAEAIGVKASQLRFPPPADGQEKPESLDDLLEDAPDNVRQMAIAAIRGMVGK